MNLNEGGEQMIKVTLKAARVNRGLSQKEAAEKLGIAESTLYKWETGKNKPNAKYLPKIEKVFGVQITNIIF
jgi:putative transcriptional regulator